MTRRAQFIAVLLFVIYVALVWALAIFYFAEAGGLLFGAILTGCGLTVLAVYMIVARLLAKPREVAAAPAPVRVPSIAPGEFDEVSELISEANARLSKSPTLASHRQRGGVNALPLYLLIGAEASGKTSVFLNSGMSPELLAGQIPTRLGNLWFAAGALVAELSGRLLGKDDGPWTRFLHELKPPRLRSPLRRLFSFGEQTENLQGVFLFCDLKSFLGVPDSEAHNAQVAWIRERLYKIGEIYDVDFPVYLVFTRADAIPCFEHYFARLREVEDQQILGCTLELQGADAGKEYAASERARLLSAFNSLYHSLAEKRMTFLERELERANKPMIYEFPRELKRIRPAMVEFLVNVFRPNPLRPGPMLRGFYFTGVRKTAAMQVTETQHRFSEATRIFQKDDLRRVAGVATAEVQSPPREHTADRWTFVSQLFNEAMTKDRGLTGPAYTGRRVAFYRRVIYGGLAALCALAALLFCISWSRNRGLVEDAEQKMAACLPLTAENHGTPPLDKLRRLEDVREQLARLIQYKQDGPPWSVRFGLYTGSRILPSVQRLYFDRFREYFLDRVVRDTEARLSALRPSANLTFPYDAIYGDLKSYRTVTTGQEAACGVDAALAPWLTAGIERDNQVDAESQQLIQRNAAFYVRELGARRLPFTIAERKSPVDDARRYLAEFGGELRIYRAIIDQTNASIGRSLNVTEYAPNYMQVLSGPQEVPAAFSLLGRSAALDRIKNAKSMTLGESCVLGKGGAGMQALLAAAELEPHLRNLYLQDYLRTWREFVAGQKFSGYRNTADAAKKLDVLQDNASPLVGLMFMVHENTTFPADGSQPAKTAMAAAAPSLIDRLGYRFGRAGRAARATQNLAKDVKLPAQQATLNTADITAAFQPVHEIFTGDATRQRWIGEKNRAYLAALTQMQRTMDALARSSNAATDVNLNNQADQAMLGGIDRVKAISETFLRRPEKVYEDVARLLDAPFQGAHPLIVTDFAKAEGNKLNGALAHFCGQLRPVLQKYPFNTASENDATAQEVSSIFAPQNGALWRFYQEALASLLVKQGQAYVVKTEGQPQGSQTRIAPEFVNAFNRLALVTAALFPDGGPQPRMHYRLAPGLNPSLKSISLTIDGENMTWQAKQFFWPGGTGRPELRLYVKTGDVEVPFASYPGIWGIFAMMTDADFRPPGSHEVGLTSLIHGRRGRAEPVLADGKPITVRIEIQEFPGGVEASFDRDFFSRVRCPARVAEP